MINPSVKINADYKDNIQNTFYEDLYCEIRVEKKMKFWDNETILETSVNINKKKT